MSHYDHHRQESSGSASGDIEKQDISISEDVKENHGTTYEAVDPAADKRCVQVADRTLGRGMRADRDAATGWYGGLTCG